jgi:peptidyl-dipeptidase Dcp
MIRATALVAVGAALLPVACASSQQQGAGGGSSAGGGNAPPSDNPLLEKWSGPHGGVPPFARIKVEHFEPALAAGMDETRREIAAIADNPAAPTFDNTIAALEDSGRTFRRVQTAYQIWGSTMKGPAFQKVERAMAPRLAAFGDEIVQNEKLFRRIAAVHDGPEKAQLAPEQQRLVWRIHMDFVRAGAKLDPAAKKQLAELNQKLATLYTSFEQNLLADEEGPMVLIESEAELDGLPDSVRAAAAAAAEARGHKGKWVISNTRSAVEPFLTYSNRRELRQKVWQNFVNRGDNGGEHDNNEIIAEVLKLRFARANLLGYPTHAHWQLADSMAKTPERALGLMESVWPVAVARVREEVADMLALAKRESRAGGKGGKTPAPEVIEPWDYRYYAEKVRKAKYDLDQNEVKPYLQLEKLREAMFWVAGELLDFSFTPVEGLEVYHPDVRVWEVKDRRSGKHVGLWYFDAYARPGKSSGAWMNAYREQERFRGEVTTIVSNNSNFMKGKPGEAILISWEDARTLFHEFGHALHGLSSNVSYPTLSGTSVPRDYVEFPSQLLEHWLSTPEVLNRFARHHQTGAPIPAALVERIQKAATFNQGFSTVEYLGAALVDMKLHLAGGQPIDPDAFEKETLRALGMPREIVMRHRTPQFAHIFGGDGYSAAYYSYLWSDTLSADAYEAFTEAKGPYDREVASRLRKNVFSVGNTLDPAAGYRTFRGRDPGTEALMRKRGFAKPHPSSTGGGS